jgi:glycosyltransferase involved in cell wall biosynthesis
VQNLLIQLEQLDHATDYVVLVAPETADEYQPQASNFRKVMAPYAPYSLGEQLGLAWLIWRLRPNLVHFPAFNAPLFYFGRRVTTVHDLTLLSYSTSRRRGLSRTLDWMKQWGYRLVLGGSIWQSRAVLAPSQYVKHQLDRRYHLAAARVRVTPLAVDAPLMAGDESNDHLWPSQDYLLYVGNCYPYKNVGLLVEAFRLARSHYPQLKLILVGRDDFFRQRIRARVTALGLDAAISFTGEVSDNELASLYRQAKLYVYPSLSEGFGLQGLEAMSYGLPVLAARASCLPETCGEAAAYFEPGSADDLSARLLELLGDEAALAAMRATGLERVKGYSWAQTGRQTQAAYLEAVR